MKKSREKFKYNLMLNNDNMPIQHNTDLDSLGKTYLPEGPALSRDRATTAHKVVDNVDEWVKAGTNKTDLKGFDTRRARERRAVSIIKELKGIRGRTTSGEDAILEEPERFIQYLEKELTSAEKAQITNFNSFKQAMDVAFNRDKSLRNLLENVQNRDLAYEQVFNTDKIQALVNENAEGLAIRYIMKKYNVEPRRATQIYDKLGRGQRFNLVKKVIGGRLVKLVTKTRKPKPGKNIIRQVSMKGNLYVRSKPQRWTKMETQLLQSNMALGIKRVKARYEAVFRDKRSARAVETKFYRLMHKTHRKGDNNAEKV